MLSLWRQAYGTDGRMQNMLNNLPYKVIFKQFYNLSFLEFLFNI